MRDGISLCIPWKPVMNEFAPHLKSDFEVCDTGPFSFYASLTLVSLQTKSPFSLLKSHEAESC